MSVPNNKEMQGYTKIGKYTDVIQDRKTKVDATILATKKRIEEQTQRTTPIAKEQSMLILEFQQFLSWWDICCCCCSEGPQFRDEYNLFLSVDFFNTVGYADDYDKLFDEFDGKEFDIEKGYYEGCKGKFYLIGSKSCGTKQVGLKIEK